MLNKVTLIGNLGRDPEIRRFENGAAVAKFSVATNENYKDKEGNWQTNTEWHEIVLWRLLAERASTTLKKGSLIYLEGKLTHRKYQDKDGNDRYRTEIVAQMFRSLEKRESSNNNSSYFPSPNDEVKTTNNAAPSTPSTPASTAPVKEQMEEAADDDLPF